MPQQVHFVKAFLFLMIALTLLGSLPATARIFPVNLVFASSHPEITIQFPPGEPLIANGSVFYVDAGETISFTVRTQNAELLDLSPDSVRPTVSYTGASPNVRTFTWNTMPEDSGFHSTDPEDTTNGPKSLSYGVTFSATGAGGVSNAQIIIVVESPDYDSSPRIELDRPMYGHGDIAHITVFDPHAICNFNDIPETLVRPLGLARASSAADSRAAAQSVVEDSDFSLQYNRDKNRFETSVRLLDADSTSPGTFRIQPAGQLGLAYMQQASCDVSSPVPEVVVSQNVPTVGASLNFSRPQYTVNDIDGLTNQGRVILRVPQPVAEALSPIEVNLHLDGVPSTILTLERNEAMDLDPYVGFSGDFQLVSAAGLVDTGAVVVPALPDEGKIAISAEFQAAAIGASPLTASATVFRDRALAYDDAEYYSHEMAEITLTDPSMNIGRATVDSAQVLLCSYGPDSGPNPVLLGSIRDFILREIENDYGRFTGLYHLAFANATNGSEGLAWDSTIRVSPQPGSVTSVYAMIQSGSVTCPDSPSAADMMHPIAAVIPSPADLFDGGRGGENLPDAHDTGSPPLRSGGVSAISCGSYGGDTDGDSICNNWEPGGATALLTINYGGGTHQISNTCNGGQWGDECPDYRHKDIFLEIDYVDATNGCTTSFKPSTTALNNVRKAFNSAPVSNTYGGTGVWLHYTLDENISNIPETAAGMLDVPSGTPICYDDPNVTTDAYQGRLPVWGGQESFDDVKYNRFGTSTERGSNPSSNLVKAKLQVYHYVLFINQQLGINDLDSSGTSEFVGNDIIVSLGHSSFIETSVDQQQGTLMHELGHNLGLDHGGPDVPGNDQTINCKPNYLSAMSYTRQFTNAGVNNTLHYSDDTLVIRGAHQKSDPDPDPPNTTTYTMRTDLINAMYEYDAIGFTSTSLAWPEGIVWGQAGTLMWDYVENDNSLAHSDINWDQNEGLESYPSENSNIMYMGMTGCMSDTTGDSAITGAVDWPYLKYDFRTNNAQNFGNGLGRAEVDSNVTREIRVGGIEFLNRAIQNLESAAVRSDLDPDEIKAEFNSKLITEQVGDGIIEDRVVETVSDNSTANLLLSDDLAGAIDELMFLRKYVDATDGGNSTDDLFVSKDAIDFSRIVLPIPPEPGSDTETLLGSGEAITTLFITDPDQNLSSAEDNIDFSFADDASSGEPSFIVEMDGQGSDNDEVISSSADYFGSALEDILPGLNNLILSETGGSTGVFDEELAFEFGSLSLEEWQGLEVIFTYIDQDGDESRKGIVFKGHDGMITSSHAAAANGAVITVEIIDSDLDLDDGELDEFDSTAGTNVTFLGSVNTEDDHISGTEIEVFTETGENTGIFVASWEIGQDIPITAGPNQATRIVATYNDEVDSDGNLGEQHEVIISVVSGTGVIGISPDEVGPDSKVRALITDTDLNQNSSVAEEYVPDEPDTDDFFVSFTSDRDEVGEASPTILETGPDTGVFEFTLQFLTNEEACEDDDLGNDPSLLAAGGSDASIGVCPGDLIAIRYEDDQDSKGASTVVSQTIEVQSLDPEFAADSQTYDAGDEATITMDGPHANSDPNPVDSTNTTGTSDSEALSDVRNVLRILDNNIASLKVAMNVPFDEPLPFEVTSMDQDCGENTGCTIVGYSDSVTSVANTFHIDTVNDRIALDVIGQGRLELHIPSELTPYVSEVRSASSGNRFEHTSTSANDTTIVVIDELSYFARQLDLGFDKYDLPIKPSDPSVGVCEPDPTPQIAPCFEMDEINAGDHLVLMTPIINSQEAVAACTFITEVRNAQGVTVSLTWNPCTTELGGAMGEDDTAVVLTDLTLDEPGEYRAIMIILDNMDNPNTILGYDQFQLPRVI